MEVLGVGLGGEGLGWRAAHLPSAGVRLREVMTRQKRSHSSRVEYEGSLGGSWKLLISVEQSSSLGRKSVNFSWRWAVEGTLESM